jgi:hypothetical protein
MGIVGLILSLIVIAILAGGGVHLFLRRRSGKEEPHYTFRCPKCRRKFHYRASRAGHRGVCPICKQHFLFPPPPSPEQADFQMPR